MLYTVRLVLSTIRADWHAMHLFMKSAWRCCCTKLQSNVKCVVLRHRRQQKPLLVDAVNDEADQSLMFELGNSSAINGRGRGDNDCVVDVVFEYALIWATSIDLWEYLLSLVFS